MHEAIEGFKQAMQAAGLTPPATITPGKFHRFAGVGKPKSNRSGWCRLFEDGLGGCFGDWPTDLSETWQAKRANPLTDEERQAFVQHVREAERKAEAERKDRQAKTATKATAIWNKSLPAPIDHPYLVKKGIKPFGARLHRNMVVVPARSGGQLHSLQLIGNDGKKRFLSGGRVSGCYFSMGSITPSTTLCIVEGFATGATVHEATGWPVAVAFNTSNLLAVAEALREAYPNITMVICADDDANTEGNPGLTKANEAALAIGAKVAVPEFGPDRPLKATDFNDLAALRGVEAVSEAIDKAINSDDWPEPIPLINPLDQIPYPLDALPKTIHDAVAEVQGFSKAPLALIASGALAALSLAGQAHANVERAKKLTGPCGLFFLTIAESGERKSTCETFFTEGIHNYVMEQRDASQKDIDEYNAKFEAWEAKKLGLKDQIRNLAKNNSDTSATENSLREHEHQKPVPPKIPRLILEDATPEALKWSLAKNWPSGGIISSEAGSVFGSHGMARDSLMRNLATLNQMWDGKAIATERRTSESFCTRGARLTIALQVQEPTLHTFFERAGELARGSGFLARFLLAYPATNQGTRFFSEPPDSWSCLKRFNNRIETLLRYPMPFNDAGILSPPLLQLHPAAKAKWIVFHDAIEHELRIGGELQNVRDIASKIADNAVRIAALFHLFEHGPSGAISAEHFAGAARIAAWHLQESKRFFEEIALPIPQANVIALERWILQYCRTNNTTQVSRRAIQRNVTPTRIRKGESLSASLHELACLNRIREVKVGKEKTVQINPALLAEDYSS